MPEGSRRTSLMIWVTRASFFCAAAVSCAMPIMTSNAQRTPATGRRRRNNFFMSSGLDVSILHRLRQLRQQKERKEYYCRGSNFAATISRYAVRIFLKLHVERHCSAHIRHVVIENAVIRMIRRETADRTG